MPVAIFGISNDGLNLAANLFVLMLVVVWLALIAYTYFDSQRRVEDPVLVACATAASLIFPYVGTAVYAILRPPEYLDDARERELETKAAELRVRQLSELSCPNCGYPVEKNYLRCPNCQRRLKDPCQSCGKPVDPRWALCPYCETQLPGRAKQPPRPETRKGAPRGTRPAQRPQRPRKEAPQAPQREAPRGSDSGRGARRSEGTPPRGRQQAPPRATAVRDADGNPGERDSGSGT
jgi:double zinc ribbon protein